MTRLIVIAVVLLVISAYTATSGLVYAQKPSVPDSLIKVCSAIFQYQEYLGSELPKCDHDILYFKGLCETTNATEKYCYNFDLDRYLNMRGITDATRPPASFCNIYNSTTSCEY